MRSRGPIAHPVTAARRATRRRIEGHDEAGFTLIELIIVIAILPIVVGGISVALLSVFKLQGSVSGRVSESDGEQVASAKFNEDVQSAAEITTMPAASCGSAGQTQLLGLEWNLNQNTGTYGTVVSYMVATGSTTSLVRQACTSGNSTPTTTAVLSSDVGNLAPPTITTSDGGTLTPTTSWVSTRGVTGVTFNVDVTDQGVEDHYTLVGLPGAGSSSGTPSINNPNPPLYNCGYSTSTSSFYANSLCFINFSFLTTGTPPNPPTVPSNCQSVTEGILNTPYTISFCISEAANGPVTPSIIPTYYDPGGDGSEAFLGNNGFYTGIPGDPALYQYDSGDVSTVYITNIQVTNAVGEAATNWTLVTGDAESTDAGEYIQWTSNQDLNVLDNNPPTDDLYGNACYDAPGNGVTGLGSTTVKCASSVQLDKTGTLMLQAPAPTTLTVTMKGAGLQAFFLGVLL